MAVVLTYTDMRRRLKQDREFSDAQAKLIKTFQEELKLFRKQLSQRRGRDLSKADLERQKLLQRRAEHQWRQFRDIAKAVGRIIEELDEY